MSRSVRGVLAFAIAVAGCGDDGNGGTGKISSTQPVGPAGAMVAVDGLQLVIPPGALGEEHQITVTATSESAPDGFTAVSPVFRLTPEGLIFLQPIEVRIALPEPVDAPSVFWSKLAMPGYDDVGGRLDDESIIAENTHFSTLFAGLGPPALVAMPQSLDFGSVVIGTTSVALAVTITNNGATPSGIPAVTVTSEFAIASTTCIAPLAPGASCTTSVEYAPVTLGGASGMLAITTPGAVATVALQGIGIADDGITIDPTVRDFGTTAIGTASAASTFTITNNGILTVTGLVLTIGGASSADFSIGATTCTATLAASATCTVAVMFTPSVSGARTATLTATTVTSTATAALSGNGVVPASLEITPSVHDYGTISVFLPTAPVTFTVTNSGGVASGVLVVGLGGFDAGAFTISNDTCTGVVLAPAATCTLAARFAPSNAGAKAAPLSVSATPGGTAIAGLIGSAIFPPPLSVSASMHDFGAWLAGSSSTVASFSVTNTGGVATAPLSTSLGGNDPGEFEIITDSCAGVPLAVTASCTVSVQFTPTAAGLHTANVTISGTPGGIVQVGLVGTGFAPAALVVSPTPHAFGSVTVGATSASSTFTVTNTGGAPSGAMSVALLPGPFSIGASTCTGLLSAGQSCTVSVTFAPTVVGASTASLTITATPGGTAAASISGTGLAPASLVLAPTPHDFGTRVLGSTSAPAAFTLTNTGGVASGDVATSLAGINPSDYAIVTDTCAGVALAIGASCTITVRFSPTAAGARTATLGASATPGGTATAALSGTGLAPAALAISPSMNDFGSRVVTTSSPIQMFAITNTGGVTSGAIVVAMNGNHPNEFSIVADACTAVVLAPAATCNVSVVFVPLAQGARMASLEASSAPGELVAAGLSGTGLAPASLSISPTNQSFGGVPVGATSTATTFTVTNGGGVTSGLLGVTLAGTHASEVEIVASTCSGTLAPAQTCTIQVRLAPTTAGTKSASLVVNSTPGGTVAAALTGSGLAPANLTVSPPSVDFGSLQINSSSTAFVFTVTNTGDLTSGTVATSIGGTGSSHFSRTTNCSALAAGATCTISVVFVPTTEGNKSASLGISASPGGSIAAPLAGTGFAPAAIAITPSGMDYGAVATGSTSTSTTFTIANNGGVTTSALAITLEGADPTQFGITSDSCTGVTLAPTTDCTVAVRFAPTTNGGKSASLAASATVGGTVSANLTGSGLAPAALSIAPSGRDFGTAIVGTQTATQAFTVTNTGGLTSGIVSVALEGTDDGDFEVTTTTCTAALTASATCSISVRFTPLSAGAKTASVTASATPGGSVSGSVDGTGVTAANLTISPSSQDFGSVLVGSASSDVTFTVENTGGVSSGEITTSVGGTDFEITSDGCSTAMLAPAATCTIAARFTPSAGGSLSATLAASATPGGTASADLAGTGAAAASLSAVSSVDFGPIAIGSSSSQSIMVTNTGGVPAGAIVTGLVGDDAAEFAIPAPTNGCAGVVLAPSASCILIVDFIPVSSGSKSSNVVFEATPGGNIGTVVLGLATL